MFQNVNIVDLKFKDRLTFRLHHKLVSQIKRVLNYNKNKVIQESKEGESEIIQVVNNVSAAD